MRSLLFVIFLLPFASLPFVPGAHAQASLSSWERPGTILVQVNGSLDSAMGAAFRSVRPAGDPSFSHTDIASAVLAADSTVRSLLSVPSALHGLRLRPFIPTHSIAFEEIRERSNPALFRSTESIAPIGTAESDLRATEYKIAHWFVLSFSDSISDERAVQLLRKSPFIERAEPEYVRRPCYTPNDPDVGSQFSLSLMHCFQAWDIVRCDSTMLLADADVGTDWTHEDLASAIYQNPGEIGVDARGIDKRINGIDDDSNGFIDDWHGWDFAGPDNNSPDNNPMPGSSAHGTHTAGILGAVGNNNKGIAGVAFGARIIPIKISDDPGENLLFGFQAIIYAADMRAKVVNCSWGGPTFSQAEQDVVDYAYDKDCAVVAACGNFGNDYPFQEFYPGSYQHVLSVAMVDANNNLVTGSNYNTHVDVAAPGWNVLSTVPGNSYTTMSGTSMACPNAAGVVALVRQRFPWMTAGQAMEQVRTTVFPTGGVDSSRLFFSGHGTVDALAAVSDTNTFSARLESFVIDDDLGTGNFAPGERGGIVMYVRNYLKPLPHLRARLQVVNGSPYVTLDQAIVPFDSMAGKMQIVSNDQAQFRLSVADSVPANTEVLIRVFFYDSTVGYAQDYDYLRFIVNPSYLNLNKNNLTVTFSSMGSIGYNDVLENSEGSGFQWRNAPSSISLYGRTLLFQGGLMVGADSNRVVDVVEGSDPNFPNTDLTPEVPVHYVSPTDHINTVQELSASYTDSLADPFKEVGVQAQCNAYAFSEGLAANAIVANYIFRHGTWQDVPDASDSTAAGLYLDWDVGLSGSVNVTRWDSAHRAALTYRLEQGYPYIGMRLLSPLPPGAAFNYHAIINDGSQGDINTYASFPTWEKWAGLTEFFPYAGPGDISHMFGIKNMPLRSEDSVVMTVLFALGETPQALYQTLDDAQALWEQTSSVGRTDAPAMTLEAFPNPFSHTLHISWNENGPATVSVYDAIGRLVEARAVTGSTFDFTPGSEISGFYTVDVLVAGEHLRREVIAR